MKHLADADFWKRYEALPEDIQARADKQFERLKENPRHPSLHFKRVGRFYSARVTDDYRALALPIDEGLLWFWIGPHDEYDRII